MVLTILPDTTAEPELYPKLDPFEPKLIIAGERHRRFSDIPIALQKIDKIQNTRNRLHIVEKNQLIEILSSYDQNANPIKPSSQSKKSTRTSIEHMIKNHRVLSFAIEPGHYHLYYTPDHTNAPNLFKTYDTPYADYINTQFVISRDALVKK